MKEGAVPLGGTFVIFDTPTPLFRFVIILLLTNHGTLPLRFGDGVGLYGLTIVAGLA
ncbi:hypothetical protein XNW1_4610056 [Xenorhabdus nematophila str. Websteri]|nr:hypothetical protein XNA1_3020004 [Xenorhabdus nematophila str. Anatoliense]CEF33103.1 hypothetical protein XNW1_4610056 [Xenorhabdus nematophila str. Websteri]